MKVVNLASGSDGNLTYIESQSTKILVDAGLSCSEIEKRLSLLDVYGSDIDAILISHEHSDHIKGLENFAYKHKTPVYVHTNTIGPLLEKIKKNISSQVIVFSCTPFKIGDLIISPFSVSHDSSFCVGFSISENERKVSLLTDLGEINNEALENIKHSQLIYLEANHDEKMLKQNPHYPPQLKARILSNKGHLSNESAAKVIAEIVKAGGTKQIMLSHLSRENNTPSLAYESVCKVLKSYGIIEGTHIKISVTSTLPSNIFNIN